MRIAFIALALVAAVAASPYAGNEARAPATETASSTRPKPTKVRNGPKNKHKEPTPIFKTSCNCDKPLIPAGVLSAKELCYYQYYVDMTCFETTSGGCPSPVLSC